MRYYFFSLPFWWIKMNILSLEGKNAKFIRKFLKIIPLTVKAAGRHADRPSVDQLMCNHVAIIEYTQSSYCATRGKSRQSAAFADAVDDNSFDDRIVAATWKSGEATAPSLYQDGMRSIRTQSCLAFPANNVRFVVVCKSFFSNRFPWLPAVADWFVGWEINVPFQRKYRLCYGQDLGWRFISAKLKIASDTALEMETLIDKRNQ